MKYPKWFARRRVKVWSNRLRVCQDQLNRPRPRLPLPGVPCAAEYEFYWEQMVTRALAKRVLWRKRAGVRKGGPVTKGRPYIRGEAKPELFIPYEEGKPAPFISFERSGLPRCTSRCPWEPGMRCEDLESTRPHQHRGGPGRFYSWADPEVSEPGDRPKP